MTFIRTLRSQFYGRRVGRPLSPKRRRLLATLLPQLSVDITAKSSALGVLFPFPLRTLWLEIGFGAGEHLVAQAVRHPDVGFIGCEPFLNGMARLLSEIENKNLVNIRLFADDARLLLDWLPCACLDRCFILFPDPWPKKRHHRRRLVGPANLDRLARVMKPGAELRLASDHTDYVRWMLYYTLRHPAFVWKDESPSDWHTRPADQPPTRYEQKALAGPPHYLCFVRGTL